MPKLLQPEPLRPDSWLMESKVNGIRYLPAAQRAPRRWKNGGGITYDVVNYPETADLDRFLWRVSIAEVASDGPFSIFSGIDRTMAILDGQGLALEVEGLEPFELRAADEPRAFPADRKTDARLLSGPILDLNAMSRRAQFSNSMHRIVFEGVHSFRSETDAVLVWQSGVGEVACNMGHVSAHRHDAFVAQEPVEWRVRADGRAAALLILFAPAA